MLSAPTLLFHLRGLAKYAILFLPNKPHISLDSGNGFYLGKNAFSVFAFPVISEGLFGDKWSSAFFAHSSGCALFFISGGSFKLDYESLELAYDVVRDLIQALEQDWSEGRLDEHRAEVLSGCYSVCDYTANKLASYSCEEDEAEGDYPIKVNQYLTALSLLKECEMQLTDNLSDDKCSNFIDYKKVNALVGFRAIIPYIDKLTEIIKE